MTTKNWIENYIEEHKKAIASIPVSQVELLLEKLQTALREDRRIFMFGNGGSAANASHFITDLGKGSSDAAGKRFNCLSLNDNVSWITAIGNDYAYEDIFLRQLENYAKPGDIVMALSVSGSSPNVVKAMEWTQSEIEVYVPWINGMLMVAVLILVFAFRSSSTLCRYSQ